MTGSAVLARYVGELSSRFGLILALYSRPHSSECAVSEHRAVIDALVSGDADAAMKVMEGHLEAVANRALIMPSIRRNRELSDILDSYADEPTRKKTAAHREPSRTKAVANQKASALSFQTSICVILPPRTTKRSL